MSVLFLMVNYSFVTLPSFYSVHCISDNSAFSEIQKAVEGGFRAFSQFAVFTYSQLQAILPDKAIGNISDWDNFLQLDLSRNDLPFKTTDEYVLNEDFYKLVPASKLSRPCKFVDQSICFNKTLCKQLSEHENVKSKLVRGLSAFDSAVIIDGPEANYVVAIEKLSSHFVSTGLITSGDKVKIISQYRSFVTKLRSEPAPEYDCWIQFLSAHYELQCRPELLRAYKFACLCLSPQTDMPSEFDVPMPGLESDNETFQSCVRSLQLSYRTVPHVSSLYRNAKTVNRAFRLLGRGADLLSDKKFSICNFSKGSAAKKTSLLGKLETGYRKSVLRFDRPIISSTTTTPSISRTSSANSSPSPDPSLGRISVTLDRCSGSKTGSSPKKIGEKHAKGKKN